MGQIALFLAGGAPNFTLMSGALLALDKKLTIQAETPGVKFDIVSMAGAGSVVGLLYLAPKGMSQQESLENTVNFGISDLIYSILPINYKTFAKSGPSAALFNDYWFSLPQVQAAIHQLHMTPAQKLWNDWLLFFGSMICPTDLNFFDAGFSGHPRFIDALIDFDELNKRKEHIELNAYCIDDEEIVDFDPKDPDDMPINADHLRAALSFPFIYPPYEINGKRYYEGAAFQSINVQKTPPAKIEYFIILDPMHRKFIQYPRNLWDAYTQSVMMPVSALAEYATQTIRDEAHGLRHELQKTAGLGNDFIDRLAERKMKIPLATMMQFAKKRCYTADFAGRIPDDRLPFIFDWSRSNLEYLFQIGYEAGVELADRVNNRQSDLDQAQKSTDESTS